MDVIKRCLNQCDTTEESKLIQQSGWLKPPKLQEKQLYCHNCGFAGHQNNTCEYPITSYGIILFYPVSDRGIIEENVDIQEWFVKEQLLDNSDTMCNSF